MENHYYAKTPTSKNVEHSFTTVLRGVSLKLTTASGVFSKARVDRGTKLLIESIPLPDEGAVLDLGCGYGPVGLVVAALRPRVQVMMVDVNPRAIDLARRNAKQNKIHNASVFLGDGFEPVKNKGPFTAVVTNPPYRAGKRKVYALLEQARSYLTPGGMLAVVGQTKQGIKSVDDFLTRRFQNCETIAKGGGYRVLVAYYRT